MALSRNPGMVFASSGGTMANMIAVMQYPVLVSAGKVEF